MVTVEWVFFCESVDYGAHNEVVSVHQIVRPQSGFGRRVFPFTVEPRFWFAVHGDPNEELTVITTVSEGGQTAEAPPLVLRLPMHGSAEIVADCGTLTFVEPGTFTFGLRINGEEVFTIKVPLERAT